MNGQVTNEAGEGDRAAGIALVAAAAISLLAMSHHPSGAHGGALGPIVHGVMIFALAVQLYGFAHFARRLGLGRPFALSGLVAYALSAFAHFAAATINGFVVPALVGHGAAVGHDLLLFAWESNQALARLGVFTTAAAYGLWSLDLLRRPGFEAKGLAALGFVAGAVPAVLLALGLVRMNVAGAALAYAAFGLWSALVGLHLLRGRLASA